MRCAARTPAARAAGAAGAMWALGLTMRHCIEEQSNALSMKN